MNNINSLQPNHEREIYSSNIRELDNLSDEARYGEKTKALNWIQQDLSSLKESLGSVVENRKLQGLTQDDAKDLLWYNFYPRFDEGDSTNWKLSTLNAGEGGVSLVFLLQKYFSGTEYDCGVIDGVFGGDVRKGIAKYQAENNLSSQSGEPDQELVMSIMGRTRSQITQEQQQWLKKERARHDGTAEDLLVTKQEKKEYFSEENDALVNNLKSSYGTYNEVSRMRMMAGSLPSRLGIDFSKVSVTPDALLEKLIRREGTEVDLTDDLQAKLYNDDSQLLSLMGPSARLLKGLFLKNALGGSSIGPLQIKPHSYLRSLLNKNNIPEGKDYLGDLQSAVEARLVSGEQEIYQKLMNPAAASDIAIDILSMYVPERESAITFKLSQNGELVDGVLPRKESYVFFALCDRVHRFPR